MLFSTARGAFMVSRMPLSDDYCLGLDRLSLRLKDAADINKIMKDIFIVGLEQEQNYHIVAASPDYEKHLTCLKCCVEDFCSEVLTFIANLHDELRNIDLATGRCTEILDLPWRRSALQYLQEFRGLYGPEAEPELYDTFEELIQDLDYTMYTMEEGATRALQLLPVASRKSHWWFGLTGYLKPEFADQLHDPFGLRGYAGLGP